MATSVFAPYTDLYHSVGGRVKRDSTQTLFRREMSDNDIIAFIIAFIFIRYLLSYIVPILASVNADRMLQFSAEDLFHTRKRVGKRSPK